MSVDVVYSEIVLSLSSYINAFITYTQIIERENENNMPIYILVNKRKEQEMFEKLCKIKIKQDIEEQSN